MRIISWNAQGKFREKFPEIRKLSGDIYIIHECENPLHCRNREYREFAAGGLWWGDNKNKGLGIFVAPHVGSVYIGNELYISQSPSSQYDQLVGQAPGMKIRDVSTLPYPDIKYREIQK